MLKRKVETCQYDLSTLWLWVCFFIFLHNCKVQCCMVIALYFKDVGKHHLNVKYLPEV